MERDRIRVTSSFSVLLVLVVGLSGSCGGGGGGGGGGGDDTSHDLASVLPNPVTAAKTQWPGAFSADYLRDTHFDNLIVEVDYPTSLPPSPAALDLMLQRLSERCNKPGGVTLFLDDAIPVSEFPQTLDVSDLEDLEDAHRDLYADDATKTAILYVLYVAGSSVDDGPEGTVLGLSYRAASFALFVENAGNVIVEAQGDVHEAGHLLGLVNGGCPMAADHEDPESPFHCDDPDCALYWRISLVGSIGDPDFAQFDSQCIADMQAFGGK